MDTNDLKNKVDQLKDKAEAKAEEIKNNPNVQEALKKGEEYVDKGKEWLESDKAREYGEKGAAIVDKAKNKLEDFVADKTDGKGIMGFGYKND